MNKKDYELALEVAKRAEYDDVVEQMPLIDGTTVFKPIMDDDDQENDACIGLPLVIFVRNGEARFSDPQEAIDYNYLLYKKNGGK